MKARIVLRPLAGAAMILAGIPALLLLALVLRPQLFLTTKTVGRGIQIFGRAYRPRWSRLGFEIRSPGVFEKELAVSAGDFCFAKPGGALSGCFKSLEARFTVQLSASGVRVIRIALLSAEGGELRLAMGEGALGAVGHGGFDPPRPLALPSVLSGVAIDKAAVELSSVEIAASSATTRGTLHLSFDPARRSPLALDARWTERGRGPRGVVRRGRARISATSVFIKNGRLSSIEARGAFDADGVSARFAAKARRAGPDAVSVEATASGKRDGLRFRFHGGGVQSPASYGLSGAFEAETSSGPLKTVRLEPFRFAATREKGSALPDSVYLEAAVRAEPADFRPPRGFSPPRFVAGRLILNARATPTTLQRDHFDADLSFRLDPYVSWYKARAELFAKASGRVGELPLMRVNQRVDVDAEIPRFKDLAAFLADGPYAVPAPFDALEGGLSASFTEHGDPNVDRIDFDCRARGSLSGKRQKLKFHASSGGTATRLATKARGIDARASVTLDDVALQLPHLDALKMPEVTLDPRIKSGRSSGAAPPAAARRARAWAPVSSSTSAVVLDLSVGTARPVVLYSDLTKTPVPVALDFKLAEPSGLMAGTVAVKSFDVEFFRRKATVDHMTLTVRPGSKEVGLDGLIKYKAAEAMIDIRLLGTVDKPKVVFESDPPLNQSDIIAMLVFGKSPDELDADQTATVNNTQTAVSNEAFGLASLYLFASTPIQFVGYDPAEKSYTMKFRIPGGETLELNSDFDATKSVQLRRRLSRHVAIVTEAVESQTQGNGVITMLEWFARY